MTPVDSHHIAASTGFRSTKRLIAGMLHLSATEAGPRVGPAQVRVIAETMNAIPTSVSSIDRGGWIGVVPRG
ncbi:MAG: hypothetical protein ACRDTJ_24435 [Pseudonocardiaceae bacterium]